MVTFSLHLPVQKTDTYNTQLSMSLSCPPPSTRMFRCTYVQNCSDFSNCHSHKSRYLNSPESRILPVHTNCTIAKSIAEVAAIDWRHSSNNLYKYTAGSQLSGSQAADNYLPDNYLQPDFLKGNDLFVICYFRMHGAWSQDE